MVTAGNLDILETWLYQRTGTHLTDSVFDNTHPQPSTWPTTKPPAQAGRPPPPATGR
ncbi:hypothetical protein [Streptomyces sp. NPDC006012]|uniref:hypothetical protein n=1 Tax=Streptomyces sp. NPDC006012 TaxID=3364739 RepID=UPI0036B46EFB